MMVRNRGIIPFYGLSSIVIYPEYSKHQITIGNPCYSRVPRSQCVEVYISPRSLHPVAQITPGLKLKSIGSTDLPFYCSRRWLENPSKCQKNKQTIVRPSIQWWTEGALLKERARGIHIPNKYSLRTGWGAGHGATNGVSQSSFIAFYSLQELSGLKREIWWSWWRYFLIFDLG